MKYIKLAHYPKNITPLEVQSKDNAGIDLVSAELEVTLQPGQSHIFKTGLKVHIGSSPLHDNSSMFGLYGMIVPRSGMGFKHFVRLANTVGIIDANYQGEIMVKLRNESDDSTLTINNGDRMCQMIFVPYVIPTFEEVESFDESDRGENGFGSSGK